MKKPWKTLLVVAVLVATFVAFGYYVRRHPEVVRSLGHVPPATLALLFGLYIVFYGSWVLVTRATLRLYNKTFSWQENFLFNAYSSLINFFGPGQGGPIFRGAYLKKRHGLGVKQYVFATLLYYGFFAVDSVLLMLAGTRPWWQTAALTLLAGGASLAVIRGYKRRSAISGAQLDVTHVGWIGVATLLQVLLQAAIYGVELHTVGAHASLGQVLSYTGVANLALFVSLTPGAIGIREGFLLFSQHLHHIGSTNIVAANIIDRGMWLLLLAVLLLMTIVLHAKDKLQVQVKQTKE